MLNIALIGYGKMGKTIETLAREKGHQIALIIDIDQPDSLDQLSSDIDVAIEFTRPEAAFLNISSAIRAGVPIVSGTTGWLERKEEIIELCKEENGGFFYASNYSIGVNIFFALNKSLVKLMQNFPEYDVEMTEIHHTEKLDAPSGTAITLAEGIIEQLPSKNRWSNENTGDDQILPIISKREPNVPGTHLIKYHSSVDDIEIKHTAHTRLGFAHGALSAAEWLVGKTGVYGMSDLLKME